ncbi:MAG TPA: hypothetical protein ENK52_04080 [Saprospiraceae bacterium]|nr:hypothetical protein [Saprospiraceae bacterium]
MKVLNKLIFGIFLLIYSSCNLSKPVGSKEDSSSIKDNIETEICSDYYLSNRTTDCNMSLRYMRSLIEPDTINTKFGFVDGKRLGFISFNIKGESNPNNLEKLELFFIDLHCFKQIKPLELFKLICSEKDFLIIEEELTKPNNSFQRYIFECSISHMNCFSIIVNKGMVENTSWCIQKASN